jgi:hypothetical protein
MPICYAIIQQKVWNSQLMENKKCKKIENFFGNFQDNAETQKTYLAHWQLREHLTFSTVSSRIGAY